MLIRYKTPKNPLITIGELQEERTFVSGNKNWRTDFAKYKGKRFEVGATVSWTYRERGEKTEKFVGKIEWIILVDDGSVEVAIDNDSIGRLNVEEIKFIKK